MALRGLCERSTRRRAFRLAAAAALLAAGALAHGADQARRFALPLRCEPGRTCWIGNYFDVDPGPAARDYACGHMSYNTHNGTDFALRDLAAMEEGVPVLAAAAGVVRGARDGARDGLLLEAGRQAVKDRECGNGVRIEHPGGWMTIYCHLRKGSIAVREGQRVSAGTRLGLVGLSGGTEFPHLHFTVLYQRRAVDPFQGFEPAACGPGRAPLWDDAALAALPYRRGALYNTGVAAGSPSVEAARRGAYRALELAADAPLIALWAEAYGTQPGDAIVFELAAPGGTLLIARRAELSRTRARDFRWAEQKREAAAWPAGKYRAKISYIGTENPPRVWSTVEFVVEVR